jgi:hypothetical protein
VLACSIGKSPGLDAIGVAHPMLDDEVAALAPAELAQTLPERVHERRAGGAGQEADAGRVRFRLSWRGARRGEYAERERRDERADDPQAARRAGRNPQ